ncbi:MAG: L-seryl-tRNA(Sec) selenium transferase [Myxococcales bacterium]|nr:L-seryl-tRNA(Sec) selenium transferase [Myxococcales bacterium]
MDHDVPVKDDPRRGLPQVDAWVRELQRDIPDLETWAIRYVSRREIEAARQRVAAGEPVGDLRGRCVAAARRLGSAHPRRVINGTGVVVHTNLGRSVLSEAAARAVAETASGYSDLELDLVGGRRGDRLGQLGALLCAASGAEAALAVNNNAAALLLLANTLARGREVVVSRGELVEIGGSFRVPDILERAGVRLVEVGTTNRTHPRDYHAAIGPETGLLLKVHPSNFAQQGYVAEVPLETLVAIGAEEGVPVVEDLGSGLFGAPTVAGTRGRALPADTDVRSRLHTGVDALCFSGDKLLGGPQAGIILGKPPVVADARRNPLARALRLDKLSIAGLDATLRELLAGDPEAQPPTLRQLELGVAQLAARAEALAKALAAACGSRLALSVEPAQSSVGGGSVPGFELETRVVALRDVDGGAEGLARRLREAPVPLLTRVRGGAVTIDVRTLLPGEDAICCETLAWALEGASKGQPL